MVKFQSNLIIDTVCFWNEFDTFEILWAINSLVRVVTGKKVIKLLNYIRMYGKFESKIITKCKISESNQITPDSRYCSVNMSVITVILLFILNVDYVTICLNSYFL